jgi:hypothetical protein
MRRAFLLVVALGLALVPCTFEIPRSGRNAVFDVAGMAGPDGIELLFTQVSI